MHACTLTPLVIAAASAHGQTSVRCEIGFREIHEIDHSRAIAPRRDFEGTARRGEIARPMQILEWYPSRVAGNAKRLTFADYLLLSSTRDSARPITPADRLAARGGLQAFSQFGTGRELSESGADSAMNRRFAAVRDAAPLRQRFPVVIAGVDGGSSGSADDTTLPPSDRGQFRESTAEKLARLRRRPR